MFGIIPGIETMVINPPNLKWPRLRCLLLFSGENPYEPRQVRVLAWCMPDFKKLCYDTDKKRSQAASKLALPHLLTEINAIKEPQQAGHRLLAMARNPAKSALAIRGRSGEDSGVPLCTLSTNVGNGEKSGPEFSNVYIA